MNYDEKFVAIEQVCYLKGEFTDKYIKFCLNVKHSVADHKRVFGKQSRCWTGSEFRFWIWDTFYYWRVLVSDKKGVCFEVRDSLSEEEVLRCWTEYTEYMSGIKHIKDRGIGIKI